MSSKAIPVSSFQKVDLSSCVFDDDWGNIAFHTVRTTSRSAKSGRTLTFRNRDGLLQSDKYKVLFGSHG